MAARLATFVHVHDEHDVAHVFGPDDVVPAALAARITNPDAWAVPPDPEPAHQVPELEPSESWTVAQLREYAAREDIDLGDASKKADILALIQAAGDDDDAAV